MQIFIQTDDGESEPIRFEQIPQDSVRIKTEEAEINSNFVISGEITFTNISWLESFLSLKKFFNMTIKKDDIQYYLCIKDFNLITEQSGDEVCLTIKFINIEIKQFEVDVINQNKGEK